MTPAGAPRRSSPLLDKNAHGAYSIQWAQVDGYLDVLPATSPERTIIDCHLGSLLSSLVPSSLANVLGTRRAVNCPTSRTAPSCGHACRASVATHIGREHLPIRIVHICVCAPHFVQVGEARRLW